MIYEIAINSWEQAISTYNILSLKNPIWAFRGQSDKKWPLSTKFERESKKHDLNPYFYRTCERNIIREFKRQASQHISALPKEKDTIDWLSLIQHFGGPTRLLDFSYSFYVAAFFATNNSLSDSAIWGINVNHLIKRDECFYQHLKKIGYYDTIQKYVEFANKVLETCQFDVEAQSYIRTNVCVVEPYVQEQRLCIQQGFFLFPTNIKKSFESNLLESLGIDKETIDKDSFTKIRKKNLNSISGDEIAIVKFTLSKRMIYEASNQLRSMNITDATLFPGIDGFARSLHNNFHDIKWSITKPKI